MCQKTELSGHREKQGSTFNTPIWNGGVGTLLLRGCLAYDAETVMTPAEKSFAATSYKQSAYLPDGLLRLCLLFDDEGLKEKFLKNMDTKQAASGNRNHDARFAKKGGQIAGKEIDKISEAQNTNAPTAASRSQLSYWRKA